VTAPFGAGSFFDARRLATIGDVLVVTINYRPGIFGAFGYPGLEGSGTFGLQDQQAALGWVQRNAAAFGGDPGNVTVFGESYGGLSTSAHLPDAQPGLGDGADRPDVARSTFTQHRLLARQVPAYAYEFADRKAPMYLPFPPDFPPGAFHAAEVPYLFPDQQFLAASTPDQRRLSDQMIRYWAPARPLVQPALKDFASIGVRLSGVRRSLHQDFG
jgi:carboxylesterase type B